MGLMAWWRRNYIPNSYEPAAKPVKPIPETDSEEECIGLVAGDYVADGPITDLLGF